MTIEEVLCARLIAQVPSVSGRVYPVQADQDTAYPFLTYSQVDDQSFRAFGVMVDVIKARFQVSAWGKSYADAKVAADETITAFELYHATVSGLEVLDVVKDSEHDMFDTEALVYHTAVDFFVTHRN